MDTANMKPAPKRFFAVKLVIASYACDSRLLGRPTFHVNCSYSNKKKSSGFCINFNSRSSYNKEKTYITIYTHYKKANKRKNLRNNK